MVHLVAVVGDVVVQHGTGAGYVVVARWWGLGRLT